MAGKTNNGENYAAEELLDMKLKDILARIAFSMDCEGAEKGDVGRLVFENEHYGFSLTVVKREP